MRARESWRERGREIERARFRERERERGATHVVIHLISPVRSPLRPARHFRFDRKGGGAIGLTVAEVVPSPLASGQHSIDYQLLRQSWKVGDRPNPMRLTPCRDELMALGFGFGREREGRERGARERVRETRGYEPFSLHAPPHTLGYIVAGDQAAFRAI